MRYVERALDQEIRLSGAGLPKKRAESDYILQASINAGFCPTFIESELLKMVELLDEPSVLSASKVVK